MSGFDESLAGIRAQARIGYQGQEPKPIAETKLVSGTTLCQQSPLLLCRRDDAGYVQVRQLFQGERGAIALCATCFVPRQGGRAGDSGVITNGRKHFVVADTVLVDGVIFHLGVLESGSFHVDKAGVLDLRTGVSGLTTGGTD